MPGMSHPSCRPMILRSPGTGQVVRVNRQFTDELGLTLKELQGRPLLEWIHPEDRGTLERGMKAGAGTVLARHETPTGDWVPFEWHVKPHAGGTSLLGLRHCDPPAVEDRPVPAPARRNSLAETLDAMALIVEDTNPGMLCSILLVEPGQECISVGAGPSLPDEYNAAVEGLHIGPAVGSCGTAAFWNVPIVVENIAEDPLWEGLRHAAELAGVLACWSHPITSTDGEVLGAMALYYTEPRAPARHQMDALDIATRMVALAIERERLEEQLLQSAKMEALGVLAGGIAHDFNNFLAIVVGNAELALRKLDGESDVVPHLREIVTASVNATDLCNQMLAYAGRGPLSTERLDCNALIEEIGGLLRVALSKKASFAFELCDEPLGVVADLSQLRQVIMNLITNASEAIGDHEGLIAIGTAARSYTSEELELLYPDPSLEAGEYVELWVRDTGPGMSRRTQERIFDPFFTTKSTGRGLGLAAVQGIVRGHGGAISLWSEVGAGTRFSVLLPRVSLPVEDRITREDAGTVPSDACILVVDDEPKVLDVLSGILDSNGYAVLRAADGSEAIDIFRTNADSIDCVILDLSMPKLDGLEVFTALQKIHPDVRVILSSGFTEHEIISRFHGAGLAGVVQKPTRIDVLLAKIDEALSTPAV